MILSACEIVSGSGTALMSPHYIGIQSTPHPVHQLWRFSLQCNRTPLRIDQELFQTRLHIYNWVGLWSCNKCFDKTNLVRSHQPQPRIVGITNSNTFPVDQLPRISISEFKSKITCSSLCTSAILASEVNGTSITCSGGSEPDRLDFEDVLVPHRRPVNDLWIHRWRKASRLS